MSRVPQELLNPARYPFCTETSTRFSDLDLNKHINNVGMAGMIEDARFRFHHHIRLPDFIGECRPLIVMNEVNYIAEAYYPAPMHFFAGVTNLGRTSWTLGLLGVQNDKPCSFARSVFVCTLNGHSMTLPPVVRDLLNTQKIEYPVSNNA